MVPCGMMYCDMISYVQQQYEDPNAAFVSRQCNRLIAVHV